jgi:hypothetical protein
MAHEDLETVDEQLLMEIAKALEEEWNMCGLADGLYFNWAAEIALRFHAHKLRETPKE